MHSIRVPKDIQSIFVPSSMFGSKLIPKQEYKQVRIVIYTIFYAKIYYHDVEYRTKLSCNPFSDTISNIVHDIQEQ